MDIPRALVITGIAVVSYLMIQAWQRDYMSPQTTPVAQEQTQADDIAPLAALQGELLDALWPTLAVGGVLLYATCSVLPTENREVIEAFLTRTPGARELDLPKGFGVEQPHGRQLLPQDNGHDGFYYAKLIKVAAQPNGRQS